MLVDTDVGQRAAPILSKLNVVRSETLETRRAEVEAVIEALVLAARDFQSDPQKWVAAMQEARPDVPESDLQMLQGLFRRMDCERRAEPWRVAGRTGMAA